MGYRKLWFKVLRTMEQGGVFRGLQSVIEFGSQDIEPDLLEEFPDIEQNSSERISAKHLYAKLGFGDYACIDFDGVHNALPFDLNKDIVKDYSYNRSFDVVTAMGTAEHVFNQFSIFSNIHNLCKENGVMIVGVPMQGRQI